MSDTNLSVLGKLSWLWMNSPLHKDWPVHLLAAGLLPPIQLNQYLLIERNGLPVAYCSWAYLNTDTEAQYMIDPAVIKLEDWNRGDHLWFVDWVAPFSKKDSWEMKRLLVQKFPNEIARAIRVKRDHKRAHVMHFKGTGVASKAAQQQFAEYHREFLTACQGPKLANLVEISPVKPARLPVLEVSE
jgi:cytolysin-activating lysine-acyltransferase